jgi:antitoxin YobK
MKNDEISYLISSLGSRAEFIGKSDENRINLIQQELAVILPESYKWFLKEFGLALIPGTIILGNGLASIPTCVESTHDWRKIGLPEYLVAIEDPEGDWVYCLDTSKMNEGECPVVDWDPKKGVGKLFYKSFLDFFKVRLQESLTFKD